MSICIIEETAYSKVLNQIREAATEQQLNAIIEAAADNDGISNADYCTLYGIALRKLQSMN